MFNLGDKVRIKPHPNTGYPAFNDIYPVETRYYIHYNNHELTGTIIYKNYEECFNINVCNICFDDVKSNDAIGHIFWRECDIESVDYYEL